jgi:pyridinium-3,5-biscarboxylic acid mononucleotide synthase
VNEAEITEVVRADADRAARTGEPEVVFAEGKTPAQTALAVGALVAGGVRPVLVTRAGHDHAHAVLADHPDARWHPDAGLLVLGGLAPHP